jgi:hypothetical protein
LDGDGVGAGDSVGLWLVDGSGVLVGDRDGAGEGLVVSVG